ncbi:MAG: hypothetical protein PHR18_05525, partial [Oscillospiraceae bacterium]|nr:hypothetical protein [Oscillospiraceae bacterium]
MKLGTLVRITNIDDVNEKFEVLKNHGFESCQLVYKPKEYTMQDAETIKSAADKAGIEISAQFCGYYDTDTIWDLYSYTGGSLLENETFSFQIAFRCSSSADMHFLPVFTEVISDIPEISCYYVGYVPVTHANIPNLQTCFVSRECGLYPDILIPRKSKAKIKKEIFPGGNIFFEQGEKTLLTAVNDCWQSLWFTVNENGRTVQSGEHKITVRFFNRKNKELVGESTVTIIVIPAKLPKQELIYTNWFHYDCLSDYYCVDMFSDEHFEIMKNYIKTAVKNGMNMILTPAFTPPLDTTEGAQRKTAQLVKITVIDGIYTFDFSLMKRFIRMCKSVGINYFEHSHLFTQWGAKAAPKIMATVNEVEKQIFGWKTKASGTKYKDFLHAYLSALDTFLKKEGLEKSFLFHISDEPSDKDRGD